MIHGLLYTVNGGVWMSKYKEMARWLLIEYGFPTFCCLTLVCMFLAIIFECGWFLIPLGLLTLVVLLCLIVLIIGGVIEGCRNIVGKWRSL